MCSSHGVILKQVFDLLIPFRIRMAVDEESDTSPRNSTGGENTENKRNEGRGEEERAFECNICLDTAKDAVISMCGHLFW